MCFVYIYGASTILCFLICFIITLALNKKIKREYPELVSYCNGSFIEGIADALPLIVPVINIILLFGMIFMQQTLYTNVVNKLKEKYNRDHNNS